MLRGNRLRWEGPSKTTEMENAQPRAWFLFLFLHYIAASERGHDFEFLNIKIIADRKTRNP